MMKTVLIFVALFAMNPILIGSDETIRNLVASLEGFPLPSQPKREELVSQLTSAPNSEETIWRIILNDDVINSPSWYPEEITYAFSALNRAGIITETSLQKVREILKQHKGYVDNYEEILSKAEPDNNNFGFGTPLSPDFVRRHVLKDRLTGSIELLKSHGTANDLIYIEPFLQSNNLELKEVAKIALTVLQSRVGKPKDPDPMLVPPKEAENQPKVFFLYLAVIGIILLLALVFFQLKKPSGQK